MPLFRLVCRADSHARLMEKPGDEPAVWNLQIVAGGAQLDISVGDDVRVTGGVPHHAGLLIQVDRPADDIDQAITAAINDAEVA
jgi:hypothetical protein